MLGLAPDLGRYAAEVLSAYGVSLVLLLGITGLSWRRWRRLRAEMDRVEGRPARNRDG